jgi:hypothetical protein
MKRVLIIILTYLCLITANAYDERIWVEAKINDKPVRFAFDTGTDTPVVLFSTAAQRLGLKVTPADYKPAPDRVAAGRTELCNMQVGVSDFKTSLAVINVPTYFLNGNIDGVLGWPACKHNIILADFVSHKITFSKKVPHESLAWMKFRINTNKNDLVLESFSNKNDKLSIGVDSGSPYGVEINSKEWHDWKLAHTNQPMTLAAYYTPSMGLIVREESWADKISLGTLTLTNIPVMEADSTNMTSPPALQPNYEATLGFAALKRLDIVIDGKHGITYLMPKRTPSLPYNHNRLGAVFVPRDLQDNDTTTLVAHVVTNSPAYEAGIRNGDILLNQEANGTFEQPAGTEVHFKLSRDDKVFKATAILRNILPPDVVTNSN